MCPCCPALCRSLGSMDFSAHMPALHRCTCKDRALYGSAKTWLACGELHRRAELQVALQANLLELLNPLFVSRSQHGSGKPLPRPCALNVRCRGALRAERRWGRCLRGWERCDLFHHHPLGWWRHGPRLKWEKAAWRRQHGWPRSGASDGAPHRPQTSNSPPSSRPPFTC